MPRVKSVPANLTPTASAELVLVVVILIEPPLIAVVVVLLRSRPTRLLVKATFVISTAVVVLPALISVTSCVTSSANLIVPTLVPLPPEIVNVPVFSKSKIVVVAEGAAFEVTVRVLPLRLNVTAWFKLLPISNAELISESTRAVISTAPLADDVMAAIASSHVVYSVVSVPIFTLATATTSLLLPRV